MYSSEKSPAKEDPRKEEKEEQEEQEESSSSSSSSSESSSQSSEEEEQKRYDSTARVRYDANLIRYLNEIAPRRKRKAPASPHSARHSRQPRGSGPLQLGRSNYLRKLLCDRRPPTCADLACRRPDLAAKRLEAEKAQSVSPPKTADGTPAQTRHAASEGPTVNHSSTPNPKPQTAPSVEFKKLARTGSVPSSKSQQPPKAVSSVNGTGALAAKAPPAAQPAAPSKTPAAAKAAAPSAPTPSPAPSYPVFGPALPPGFRSSQATPAQSTTTQGAKSTASGPKSAQPVTSTTGSAASTQSSVTPGAAAAASVPSPTKQTTQPPSHPPSQPRAVAGPPAFTLVSSQKVVQPSAPTSTNTSVLTPPPSASNAAARPTTSTGFIAPPIQTSFQTAPVNPLASGGVLSANTAGSPMLAAQSPSLPMAGSITGGLDPSSLSPITLGYPSDPLSPSGPAASPISPLNPQSRVIHQPPVQPTGGANLPAMKETSIQPPNLPATSVVQSPSPFQSAISQTSQAQSPIGFTTAPTDSTAVQTPVQLTSTLNQANVTPEAGASSSSLSSPDKKARRLKFLEDILATQNAMLQTQQGILDTKRTIFDLIDD